jgi:hypothetical protein
MIRKYYYNIFEEFIIKHMLYLSDITSKFHIINTFVIVDLPTILLEIVTTPQNGTLL